MHVDTTSAFANILVHCEANPASRARCRLALDLADTYGGRLIGIASQEPMPVVYSDMTTVIGDHPTQQEEDRVTSELDRARETFERLTAGRNDVEWRQARLEPNRHLVAQARASDIVVIGMCSRHDDQHAPVPVRPGLVVMESGRPILIAPAHKTKLIASSVVVAWKDTREARRAVRDALPFLQKASDVVIVSATARDSDSGAEDVAGWLRRHRAPARVELRPAGPASAADKILELAEEIEADLIVSGAYGHSRLREWLFGGVTRDLLENSRSCLLMSH